MDSFYKKAVSVVCACILACSLWVGIASATPQDDFLQIYLAIQEADQLAQSGQPAQAKEKYSTSLSQLEKLQSKYPDWEPVIVRYRINFCKQKIAKLAHAPFAGNTASSDKPSQGSVSLEDQTPDSLRSQIENLKNELNQARQQLTNATQEASELRARQKVLEQQLTKMNQQAPAASNAASATNEAQLAQLNQLLNENQSLRSQLDQAKSSLTQAKGGDFAALQDKLDETQKKLTATLAQVESLQKSGESYQQQLEEAKSQLAKAQGKNDGAGEAPSNSDMEEKRVLRQVVERTLENEAKRDVAKRAVMAEMAALKIDAQTLKNQIDILASPVLFLTPSERELLKLPEPGLVIDDGGHISTTIQTADASEYSTKSKVPEEFRDEAERATKFFSERKFDEALAQYQAILKAYPTSLYALSNLAVVKFQQQQYSEAEQYLRQAVRQAPQDAFCHSILGIVLYQQKRYDEAVELLTRAVALDPNDPKTRNYLGISASQKGWQEVAKRECMKAVELDDKYADAHFNLAVIYTTEKPPLKELAQKHYKRALELGAPADKSLEEFLK